MMKLEITEGERAILEDALDFYVGELEENNATPHRIARVKYMRQRVEETFPDDPEPWLGYGAMGIMILLLVIAVVLF